jgi:hypothetical protein
VSENVTENSVALIASEHGVRQVCPSDILASAPAGSDSNCIVVAAGTGFGESNCSQPGKLEQAERLNPHAAATTIRFMVDTVHLCGMRAALPQAVPAAGGVRHEQYARLDMSCRRGRRRVRRRRYAMLNLRYL